MRFLFSRTVIMRRATPILFVAILCLGLLLPLLPLATNPLHPDEALYAYWAALIASGRDAMLNTVPVDKPPLFIYALALWFKGMGISSAAARLLSLAAHLASIGLTFGLGRTLYNSRTGLLAAFLLAGSPFSILFAPTALTDPMMVAWVLSAALAAAGGRPGWAGLGLGLAAASKQQGVFFVPLILGLLIVSRRGKQAGRATAVCLLVFAASLLAPLVWDAARTRRPGFWLQSSLSYGPLDVGVGQFPQRLAGFFNLLKLAAASPALNVIFAAGLPLLLALGVWGPAQMRGRRADRLLAGFCLLFVLLHAAATFQIWDRYLLGLVPLLALLLARILHLPAALIELRAGPTGIRQVATLLAAALAAALMVYPVRQAVNSRYPIGGDHGAFYGVAETAAYLRGHAGANVTLYHHQLGTHWRFYLLGFPYDFRFWQSAQDLGRQAAANAGGVQYAAFPAWQSTTLVELTLQDRGLTLEPVFKTFAPDGSPAVYLYQIVPLTQTRAE
ncbi:MAG: ArnT family glycosyltransferase [Anaerolineae bacterium]